MIFKENIKNYKLWKTESCWKMEKKKIMKANIVNLPFRFSYKKINNNFFFYNKKIMS